MLVALPLVRELTTAVGDLACGETKASNTFLNSQDNCHGRISNQRSFTFNFYCYSNPSCKEFRLSLKQIFPPTCTHCHTTSRASSQILDIVLFIEHLTLIHSFSTVLSRPLHRYGQPPFSPVTVPLRPQVTAGWSG